VACKPDEQQEPPYMESMFVPLAVQLVLVSVRVSAKVSAYKCELGLDEAEESFLACVDSPL
jgi:hypothetical protein